MSTWVSMNSRLYSIFGETDASLARSLTAPVTRFNVIQARPNSEMPRTSINWIGKIRANSMTHCPFPPVFFSSSL